MQINKSCQFIQYNYRLGKFLLSRILIILFVIGALSGATVYACPGGQMWISATSTTPNGWIKIARSSDGSQVLVKDISCETLNSVETMIFESPLPSGWVITSQQVDGAGYPLYTITCIKGALFLNGMYVVAGFTIPTDWVVTATQGSGSPSFNYIVCLAGAPYGDTETILYWSTYPTGWTVLTQAGNYKTIQNFNKVTASISNPANDLTVPSGSSVAFTGSATDSNSGATLSYSWNFGDGYTATGTTASHTYTNTGTANAIYTTTFKAWDQNYYFGTATRKITVTPAVVPVVIAISPSSVTLLSDSTQQFTVSVSGTSNTSVSWSATGGTIDANGYYQAPAGTNRVRVYYVTATSLADPTKSATATVEVHPLAPPPPPPPPPQ